MTSNSPGSWGRGHDGEQGVGTRPGGLFPICACDRTRGAGVRQVPVEPVPRGPPPGRDLRGIVPMGVKRNDGRPWIVFLTNVLYPCRTAGIDIFHYYFAKALSAYFPVAVLAECGHRFPEYRIRVRDIRSPFGRLQTLFTLAHHVEFLRRHRNRIGLVHIPYSSERFSQYYHAMLLARRYGIPHVLRISNGHMPPAYLDWLHRIYFRNAAARIGVSEMISVEYERRYGYPVETIHSYLPFLRSVHGREKLREKHGVAPDDLVFLCLGSRSEEHTSELQSH